MMHPVASQQSPLKPGASSRLKQRHSGTTESSRSVRKPSVQVVPGRPGINPNLRSSGASPRRLRLIGEGGNPAQKVWRLKMETTELTMKFPGLAGDRALVSVQNPLIIDDRSVPQPDLALLKPRADNYTGSHPAAAGVLLVVEVSDATLRFDIGTKIPLYARSGIA